MISGTSELSVNRGPINGQIWARGPCNYSFYYTKNAPEILESIWEHPGKYYLWKYENKKMTEHACTQLFRFCFS